MIYYILILLDNTLFVFDNEVFRQIAGIPK